MADGEHGGKIYGVAKTRDQASLVFDVAAQMLRNAFALGHLSPSDFKILDHQKRIYYYPTNSFYRVLASEAGAVDGVNPSAVVFDEIHRQPDDSLWQVLKKGMSTRNNPLMVALTTAGSSKGTFCYRLYEHSKNIIEGKTVDPTWLPVIYEVPESDDWTDEKNWHKAMPALGDYVDLDFIRSEYAQAQHSATEELSFRRYYCNQWVSVKAGWFGPDTWSKCGGKIDLDELQGRECYAALDIGATSDLTSFVMCFPVGDKFVLLQRSWCPREGAEKRSRQDGVEYLQWEKDGYLKLTDSNITDYKVVRSDINELGQKFKIKEIAVDAQFQGWNIIEELIEDGFVAYPHRQTLLEMNRPSREFERLLLSEKLEHGDDPILTWCANNVILMENDNLIKPVKDKYGEKVDAIQAAVMAVGRATCHKTDEYDWENEELIFV